MLQNARYFTGITFHNVAAISVQALAHRVKNIIRIEVRKGLQNRTAGKTALSGHAACVASSAAEPELP